MNMKWKLFLLILIQFWYSVDCKNLTIPMVRQKTPRMHLWDGKMLSEFGVNVTSSVKNDSIALFRYLDSEFYGKVVVGSPGKEFNVVFDTTWSDSWLISSDCNMVRCYRHNKYNHKKSSTYKPDGRPYRIDQGTYNLSGYYSWETFSVGHLRVNQTFIEMTEPSNDFLYNKADGVFGLSLKHDNSTPFVYKLLEYGNITEAIFSVYLNRDTQSKHGGNVILGFIDYKHVHVTNKKFDEITYLPVLTNLYWMFHVDKIIANNGKNKTTLCNDGCNAVVDTSTNIIIGPKADILKIYDLIEATPIPGFGRYRVDCDTVMKKPTISFVLAGKPFTLKGNNYIQKISILGFISVCVTAFVFPDLPVEQNVWFLGSAFLSEYFSIYDIEKNRIGFVKAA